MSPSAAEKLEVVRMVEESELPVKRTLAELGVSRSSFYHWYQYYLVDPEKPSFRLPLWVPVAEPDQPAFGSTVCRRLTDALRAPTSGAKLV